MGNANAMGIIYLRIWIIIFVTQADMRIALFIKK
jgi:hypothetical protein